MTVQRIDVDVDVDVIFWGLLNIFKAFFEKKIGTPSVCQTLWIQIKTIRIQVCVQTVNSLLSVDNKSHPSKGWFLRKNVFNQHFIFQKKRIDPCARFNNWSTGYRKKP